MRWLAAVLIVAMVLSGPLVSIYVYRIDLLSAVFGFGYALAGLALG